MTTKDDADLIELVALGLDPSTPPDAFRAAVRNLLASRGAIVGDGRFVDGEQLHALLTAMLEIARERFPPSAKADALFDRLAEQVDEFTRERPHH